MPFEFGQTLVALVEIRCVMHKISREVFLSNGQVEYSIEQAQRYHVLLERWYHNLPSVLQAKNIALPGQLMLQYVVSLPC